MSLHKNIKTIRTLKGLTQAEVAEKLHISEAAYNKLENDKTELSTDRLQKLADVFGLRMQDIQDFNATHLIFNQKNNKQNSGVFINNTQEDYVNQLKERIVELKNENELKNLQIQTLQTQISKLLELVNK
jgi:transcriptional regulator with XRE-family HTH domain